MRVTRPHQKSLLLSIELTIIHNKATKLKRNKKKLTNLNWKPTIKATETRENRVDYEKKTIKREREGESEGLACLLFFVLTSF